MKITGGIERWLYRVDRKHAAGRLEFHHAAVASEVGIDGPIVGFRNEYPEGG